MNIFQPPAIATETKEPTHASTEQINVPLNSLDSLIGTIGAIGGGILLFFSIIWAVRGVWIKVELSAKKLEDLEKRIETEREDDIKQRKELRDDVKHSFKIEIAQSASDICHGFELFAMEMRGELKKLGEGLEARNATVNRLGKKVDHLTAEMIGMAQQLQSQNIPIHYRRGDNGPPSNPYNYDDD